MPPKLISDAKRRTHPLVWLAAVLCTVVSIAVIIGGIVIFIGYLVIHPRIPTVSVLDAHLNKFQNDLAGRLEVQLTIIIEAENDNAKAHASFSDSSFFLYFIGMKIAQLKADPFEVRKNSSLKFHYAVVSDSIPLNPEQMEKVDNDLKADLSGFVLTGNTRVQWRVGLLGSVKYECHLHCELKFHPSNGTYMSSPCSSRAK
ncbi:NDR1/HIN1-like protein 12 [Benincasa hispida]|uniref:NDR1/HIN1-like protein 12 n=1 Tax=Benincasa hispida TaxID=102211 RepID=UPI0019026DDA|nr:NDR1/HIN1-like protein 12 [Benincasa hispida]